MRFLPGRIERTCLVVIDSLKPTGGEIESSLKQMEGEGCKTSKPRGGFGVGSNSNLAWVGVGVRLEGPLCKRC